MKRILVFFFLLTGAIATAAAQDTDGYASLPQWKRGFSIEAGAGFAPVHMFLAYPSAREEREFADKGQRVTESRLLRTPSFSLSAIWRTGEKSELVLALSATRMRYSITQYSVFGTDPDGKPRYDLSDGKEAGRTHSPVSTSLSACYRRLWLRDGHWTVYSAIALGLVHTPDKGPGPHVNVMPGFAPFGMRYGWKHFYACVEIFSFSLSASLLTAGVGWKF